MEYNRLGDDLNYSIAIVEGHACLFFEETRSRRDWINNLSFQRKLYKRQQSCMKVHGGYGRVWKSANDYIMAEFHKVVVTTKKVPMITGWSYGGAMALLAAEDFHYRYHITPQVVTY